MSDRFPSPTRLTDQITRSFGLLWTRYAGRAPTAVRASVRGDVVTCVLVDAVGAFEGRTGALRGGRFARGPDLTRARYKLEAVEIITRLTRQRVASFISSHDRDTDVATEVFELERSPGNRPRPPRNLHNAPPRARRAPNRGDTRPQRPRSGAARLLASLPPRANFRRTDG